MNIYLDLSKVSTDELEAEQKRLMDNLKELHEEQEDNAVIQDVALGIIFFEPLTIIYPPLFLFKRAVDTIGFGGRLALFALTALGEIITKTNQQNTRENLHKINAEIALRNRPWYVITLEKINPWHR